MSLTQALRQALQDINDPHIDLNISTFNSSPPITISGTNKNNYFLLLLDIDQADSKHFNANNIDFYFSEKIIITGSTQQDIYSFSPENFKNIEVQDTENNGIKDRIILYFSSDNALGNINIAYNNNDQAEFSFYNGSILTFNPHHIQEILIYKLNNQESLSAKLYEPTYIYKTDNGSVILAEKENKIFKDAMTEWKTLTSQENIIEFSYHEYHFKNSKWEHNTLSPLPLLKEKK